ncbi:equilibrative nucleoside transporter 2-like isoform X4 [Gasterosteus aculeatus]
MPHHICLTREDAPRLSEASLFFRNQTEESKCQTTTNRANLPPGVCVLHSRRLVPCIIIFVLGVGSLLPWNFFIIASQYFQRRLAAAPSTTSGGGGYSYELWMPLAANLPLVVSSLLNCLCTRCCGRGLPAALRRCCGRGLPAAPCGSCDLKHCPLVVFTMVLIIGLFAATAVLVDVDMEPRIFFYVTMATIVVINMSNGVLVGSLFGVVSLLFQQHLRWFMIGQGASGLIAALVMLVSILSRVPEQAYFIIPCVVAAVTLACYLCLGMSPRTHTHGDGVDSPQQDSQEPPGSTEMTALSNSSEAPEDQRRDENQERCSGWRVFKEIRWMAAYVMAVFVVTLSVFPVITSRVQTVSKDNAAWDKVFTCVCCLIVFNAMDLLGRIATIFVQWPLKESRWLPIAVASRGLFVPLLIMCNVQNFRSPAVFRSDGFFAFIMALFAVSNGYLASLCVAYAPRLVRGADCEAAGLVMSLFMVLGLSLGAFLSFCFMRFLSCDLSSSH